MTACPSASTLAVPANIPEGFATRAGWVHAQYDRSIPPDLLRAAEIADAADLSAAAGGPKRSPDGHRIARTRIGRVTETRAGTVERIARAMVEAVSLKGVCLEEDLAAQGFTATQLETHARAAQARAAELTAGKAVR